MPHDNGTEAVRHYQAAMAMARRLLKLDVSNVESKRDVSNSLKRLADLQVRLGAVEEAKRLYDDASVISRKRLEADLSNA